MHVYSSFVYHTLDVVEEREDYTEYQVRLDTHHHFSVHNIKVAKDYRLDSETVFKPIFSLNEKSTGNK